MLSLTDNDIDCTDMIYLDFSKAFDKADNILLHKILKTGIKIGRWLASFLRNLTQCVWIPGITRKQVSVTSGIPRGPS